LILLILHGHVAQTIWRVDCRPANRTFFFCQCAKNYIDSTNTAAAPRYAAASVTAAAPATPTPAEAEAQTAATAATAASTATAATDTTSNANTTVTSPSTTATSAAASAAAAMTATSAAATARYLREAGGAVFPVEEMECSKTYVSYFLFAKNEALIGCGVEGLRNVRRRNSGCGCASYQRKTQSGGA